MMSDGDQTGNGGPPPGSGPAGTRTTEDDTTLGAYLRVHERPPTFLGSDGHPYSVSVETERVPDLRHPWEGFLVFPRWATNGLGITGHLETPTLWTGRSEEEVRDSAGATSLVEVQDHLEAALRRRAESEPGN